MSASTQPSLMFASDNTAGASVEVMQALLACSVDAANPYGADDYTKRVERKLADLFETDVSVFLVPTGTAANALCLATLTPPWGSVLCHPHSHINNDECGAPEFYTAGAKLVSVDGAAGKMDAAQLRKAVTLKVGDVHSVQPASVSLTQATEVGSIYTLAELQDIGAICRESGLRLHMDGARFANALVALQCSPAEMTWKAGVQALSFGATKNGVLCAEAIILFDQTLSAEMAFRRKRAGHLFSKMRFLAAQLDAYLSDDLWLRNAHQANAMAKYLATAIAGLKGVEVLGEVQANILFCRLAEPIIHGLVVAGFVFYYGRWETGVVRFVTSFSTTAIDIEHLSTNITRLAQSL